MNILTYIKIWLLFLFFYSAVFSQNSDITPTSNTDLNFKKINIEIDGEVVLNVSSITQDHQGYMWMITNLGLIRYNGVEGKKYKVPSDSLSNSKNAAFTLFIDHLGDLWVGTYKGLLKYNPDYDCFNNFPFNVGDNDSRFILSITEDNNKNIWIGTRLGGLFKYEREHDRFTRFLSSSSDPINIVNSSVDHLLVDQNNNLWIGTNYSKNQLGLMRYNFVTGGVDQFLNDPSDPNSLVDNLITALYEDQQGQILIGTYKSGFHIYDSKDESLKRINFDANHPRKIHAPYTEDKVFGQGPYVSIIHQDQNGGYWIGTRRKGINFFNSRTKTFKYYDFNLDYPQTLSSFYEDRQGNIWIGGALGSGLFRTDLFSRKHTLNTNFNNVQGAYESPLNPGILWITSLQQGLSKMNLKTKEITRYVHKKSDPKSIGHNWVRSAYQENNKILWVGLGFGNAYGQHNGDGGVDRMDIETGEFTHFKLTRDDDGLDDFSYTVFNIFEDDEGYLWLGTGPGGIFRSNKEKKDFKHFNLSKNDSLSRDVLFNTVKIDSNGDQSASDFAGEGVLYIYNPNGDIWISDFEDEGALYLYNNKEEKFQFYLKGFKATNVLVDKKGWLLISTWEKGLLHFNSADSNYIQYTKKDGLPSNDALGIVEGNEGNFWISTRMGPAKFNTETGKISSIGLPKVRYNYGIFKAIDGQIFLGVNNGLVSFYPHQVIGNPYPPDVILESIIVTGKSTNLLNPKTQKSKQLLLNHQQNDLTFKYAGLHYSDPTKNKFRYMLEPYDADWLDAGTQRTARYTNIAPGEYNFKITASNSDGLWNEEETSIYIIINKPWWQTYLAYIVYILLGLSLIYSLRRYEISRQKLKFNLKLGNLETEKLKEVDQIKSRFFANISHEFRTPLTLIFGPAKDIAEIANNVNIIKNAGIIQKNAAKLYGLVNQLLDISKLEAGKMSLETREQNIIPLLKGLVLSFTSLAERKKIVLKFDAQEENINIYIDKEKIEKIITNILSNAFKFTSEGGEIDFKVLKFETEIEISVKDTGIGVPEERIEKIFDRFYQVDGSQTREGEGTGIGLALTKELVELHKGNIRAERNEGEGTTFILKLQLGKEHLLPEEIVKKEYLSETTKILNETEIIVASEIPEEKNIINELIETDLSTDKPLLLIVEDNFDVRNYIISHLEEDYKIEEAKDGEDGFTKATEKIPDLIVSDVMMPKMDGIQLCEKLKTDERTSHIPIILLTAKATSDDKIEGYETGADDYIMKPFDVKELQARIKNLTYQRKKLQEHFKKEGLFNLDNKKLISIDMKFLEKANKIINEHISDTSFGVELFASELAISRAALHKKLVALVGEPPSELIKRIRLSKAGILLKNNTGNISEIALEVGFNNPAYFSECFKKQFGETPSQHKRKFTKN